MLNTPDRAKNLADHLLDKGYADATDALIRALTRTTSDGLIARRLEAFNAEAERLAEAGEMLTADNPVYRALMADVETVLNHQAGMVDGAAGGVQDSGANAGLVMARQLTLPYNDAQLKSIGFRWNTPDPEAIASVVDTINKDEWRNQIGAFSEDVWQVINNHTLAGIALGQGPRTIARDVANLVETLPLYQANMLLRTLQLESYRQSTDATYLANADILVGKIRVETLDSRTCMACIALNGEEMDLGEPLEEHEQGRATSIGMIRGQTYDIQSGEDWFNEQDEATQRDMMGHAAYEAWQDGAIALSDFVDHHDNPVWGQMLSEASLKGMLGKGAQDYYADDAA